MNLKPLSKAEINQFLSDMDAGKISGHPTHQQKLDMINQMRDELPESMIVHLTEKEIIDEYIHHYGKP